MTVITLLPDTESPLDHATALAAFEDLLDGKVSDEAAAAFLTGLSVREETSIEIAAAAQALANA
jgi:anthranilate phosphoribosyltransferase